MPSLAIDGGFGLAAIRALFDAGLLSGFGGLLFRCCLLGRAHRHMPPDAILRLDRALRVLGLASAVVALAAGVGWVCVESGRMAGAADLGGAMRAVPTVLRVTRFGHLMLAQGALLLAAALLLPAGRPGGFAALALSGAALLLQAGHGHALSMQPGPSLLLLCSILHLLAGGIWLGGLLPLLLATRIAPPRAAAGAARSFSGIGKVCVATMAATAAFQGWVLAGSLAAILHTGYGWTEGIKLALFLLLLGFACLNRYRLAPALLREPQRLARRRLTISLAWQTAAGLAVVLAAGVLASLPPGMHDGM